MAMVFFVTRRLSAARATRSARQTEEQTEESVSMSAAMTREQHHQPHFLALPDPTKTGKSVRFLTSGLSPVHVRSHRLHPLCGVKKIRVDNAVEAPCCTAFRQPGLLSPSPKRIIPLALPFAQHRGSPCMRITCH